MPTPRFGNAALAAMSDQDLCLRLYIGAGWLAVYDIDPASQVCTAVPWYFDPLPSKPRWRQRELLWPGTSTPYMPVLCNRLSTGDEYAVANTVRPLLGEAFKLTQGTTEADRAFLERCFRVLDPNPNDTE